jgi:XTP/dITP diphosphohydrolase
MLLVVGTRNRKKRDELLELLAIPGLRLATVDEFPQAPEVVEDGASFAANAAKKASELARALGLWTLGEDSGLAVDALDGAPGIYSARYAGEPCDDEANNDKLLAALAGIQPERRGAHYVCAMAIADPTGAVRAQNEGRCFGRIAFERRGKGGFGYDPLFLFGDGDATFGELPAEVKRANSHRAAACAEIRPVLARLVAESGASS